MLTILVASLRWRSSRASPRHRKPGARGGRRGQPAKPWRTSCRSSSNSGVAPRSKPLVVSARRGAHPWDGHERHGQGRWRLVRRGTARARRHQRRAVVHVGQRAVPTLTAAAHGLPRLSWSPTSAIGRRRLQCHGLRGDERRGRRRGVGRLAPEVLQQLPRRGLFRARPTTRSPRSCCGPSRPPTTTPTASSTAHARASARCWGSSPPSPSPTCESSRPSRPAQPTSSAATRSWAQ